MATRCLIVVGDVVLYNHYDGYPEYIVPLLEDFAKWYAKRIERHAAYFPHFLYQSADVAATLIYYQYRGEIKFWKSHGQLARPTPDIRPTSLKVAEAMSNESMLGEEYVYRLQLGRDLIWRLEVYAKYGSPVHVETRKIDLAEFLSETTLERYPEFRRARSPRARAAKEKGVV